jgi:hypothetical protein
MRKNLTGRIRVAQLIERVGGGKRQGTFRAKEESLVEKDLVED